MDLFLRILAYVLAVASIGAGAVTCVSLIVLFLASCANGSDELVRNLVRASWATGIVGVLVAGAGVTLLVLGRPWVAMGVGLVPVVGAFVLMVIHSIRGG